MFCMDLFDLNLQHFHNKLQLMKDKKSLTTKLTPSQLVKKQLTGTGFFDEAYQQPRIVQFLNLADYSINTESYVDIDEPLFEAIPPVISFTDYEPLQIKEKIFKLRNKDRFSRRVKIIQPDSKLFQIILPNDNKNKLQSGTKVAAGMQTKFIVRFSPEAKIDYKYELIVVTEREKFIVPIVAIGKRAMIDFPDILDFGPCPVKFSTQKPVIIRNLGEKTTKWNLQLPQGFSSNFKEGVLQAGKNQQILVKFYPIEAKLYRSLAKIEYDKLSAYSQLIGQGQLSNVYLSKSVISMQQSYIGLQSQQTLHIVNKSHVKVNFQWRAFASQKEERPKKELICQQLAEEQAEQLMLLRELFNSNQKSLVEESELNDSSSEQQTDPRELAQRKKKRAQLALARKYKTIRKAIEDDLFYFQDNIFKIEPLNGEIWPNSEITITVTFTPTQANTYDCMSYCNISCAEERLPLKLKGEGLGPKAYLTQQQINFGDIFVNQPIKQPIQIQNRGQIPCHFTLEKPERAFAKMFEFSVEQKTLEVGQSCSFQIRFKSSIPGQFKQKFRWNLQGSQRNLEMTFLGHVIAPTFQFVDPNDTLKSKSEINFGKVSYDFQYKEGIILKNTSSVEFAYNLKILSQNKLLQNQFKISPQSGTIPEKSQKLIQIEFTPKSIKKYETVMTIDIEGVGNDMLSVPIKADCQVPHVDITPSEKVEFAQACLNYPETRTIILKNHSDIKAKFSIVPQSEESKVLAKYSVYPETGVIDEKQSKQLQITLITCKLGEITLPLNINIIGTNNNQPNLLNICANSDGPRVVVTPEELDFGQVQVLKEYFLKVNIVNNSKIRAEFHAFTRQKISIFKPKVKHAFLEPGEKLEFDVICNADDASKFNDILHFVVKDGKDKDIILKAKGIGSTIYCEENLENLNFGTIYTYKTAVKEIFIQNRGRKSQKLTWQRKITKDKKKKQDDKPDEQIVFTIDPQTQTIPPKYGRYFRFIAMSQKKGKIVEQFFLMSQVGSERKANQLCAMNIEGDFTQPNIIYSEKKLFFKYFWQRNLPILLIDKELSLTSGSNLPLNFNLKLAPPFSVNQENHSLQPNLTDKVKISFDPNFKIDKTSGIINGKINVVYADHPYRESIDLIGEVCFPNLKMEASIINFGAILNDTTKKISMLMKNVSLMPVTYEWAFLEEEIIGEEQKMNISSNSMFPGSVPINEVFDILPLSGVLEPDQIEEVQFIYNAQGGILYRATAICHVEGGPNYEVKLQGDSSLISGKISQKQLDFGQQKYCQWNSKDIYIENTGKVTFQFKVDLEKVKKKAFLEVIPQQGKISGGQKHKITIRICPTMPNAFEQLFDIQMGYYDPQIITVKGIAFYPELLCQFPRIQNQDYDNKLAEEVQKYSKEYDSQIKKLGKDKAKAKTKEIKSVEQYKQQVEKELDRKFYCNLIKQEIVNYIKPEKPNANNLETKLFENVFLTSWICDFGNVIVGSTQKKMLKYKNVGDFPIEMVFDVRTLKTSDFKITPDKVKLAQGEQTNITVTLATKKNTPCKKIKNSITLEVKNGAKYKLQILSNLTVPEIIIDGNPEALVDFQKVLCGQRKIVTLRFLNEKEVNCDWSLNLREPAGKLDKDNQVRFELKPSFGRIAPGSFQIVKVYFTPTQEKEYTMKFPIKIQQNPKVINLQLKGIGATIALDSLPNRIRLGPVLPYNNKSYAILQISNPSKYATEITSLDFDKNYKSESQILSAYEDFKNGEQKDIERVVFLPLREPGAKIWPEVIKEVQKANKIKELKKSLQTASEQNKPAINTEIQKLMQPPQIVQYPKKVDPENVLHLIMFGPNKSGKTHIAQTISKLQKRALIKFDEIIDWNMNNGTQVSESIKSFLSERKKELQLAAVEREKAFKKAGKKAKELQEKIGSSNEAYYEFLPQNIWVQAIKLRIKHPECNAGCVFDNIKSKHVIDQLTAVSLILKAVGNQAVSLVDVCHSGEERKIQVQSGDKKTLKKLSGEDEQEQVVFQIIDGDENQKKKYEQKYKQATKLFRNELEFNPTPQLFRDPIFFQINKDEAKQQFKSQMPTHLGNRDIIPFSITNSNLQQKKIVKEIIPIPFYRDPMKQPLPEPTYEEAIAKSTSKPFESRLAKEFQIYTPKQNKYTSSKRGERREEKKKTVVGRKDKSKVNEQPEPIQIPADYNFNQLIKDQTRWILPPETTLKLYLKFYSKVPGNFQSNLTFQNTFNLRKIIVPINGKTTFPSISNAPKTLFLNVKKSRPTTIPEGYLSKAFVLSENVFDFGPLLLGKNAEKKNEKDILNVNSAVFKLLNNGSYPADLEFAFLSTIIDNDPAFKKNIFTVSSQRMQVEGTEITKQIRVWAIPDEAREFKDQLIVMIKNNPIPVVIPLRCQGSKPTIQILEGAPLKFTRILLSQTIKRELKVRNSSAIPIDFRLEGCQKLPAQFAVNIKQGRLKPNESITIQVTFKALKQQKFNQVLKLVAQDIEGLKKISEGKDIAIEAEAFDISVQMKFPNDNTENLLNYEAVRVGDFVDRSFTVKNIGLYNVKLSFLMKKKLYKDSFKIEPSKLQLQPNTSKEILIRFSSLKQVKLKTNNNTTDIIMEVLEGKTLEITKTVPINVAVNSVFSSYSITPLKNMNFGPVQFNQTKTRTFQIKNQGLFQFNFSLFDNLNEEFRKQLIANVQKDRQTKLQAANNITAPVPVDPKKAAKKQTKEVKKDSKKAGKGGKQQVGLKIGQWSINPNSGTIGPDSSAIIEVSFSGKGQKLFQHKLAVDIENRNPTDEPNGILYQFVAQSCIPGINTDNFQSIFEEQLVLQNQQQSNSIENMIKSNVFYVDERLFNFGTLVPSKSPEGIVEKIKIQNNNKVACTVKLQTKKKTPNAIEQFAFDVEPKEIKIPPHEHQYVKLIFNPTIMASYAGMFSAVVQNGEQEPKTHKLTFDLKGEGALPTIKVEKPKQYADERTFLLKFPKTRIGKTCAQSITLKNEGIIPATAKFQLTPNDHFKFIDSNSNTLTPKSYAIFNIQFKPKEPGVKVWQFFANTLLNQFEVMRFKIQGQAYNQDVLFENLPLEQEDKINFGDCVINEEKRVNFSIKNNSNETVKFQWVINDDFTFIPRVGHINSKTTKAITIVFKSAKAASYKDLALLCQTNQVKQAGEDFHDWDDSMKIKRFVTKSQFEWLERKKDEEKKKRQQQAELAKKGGKKDNKKAAKKDEKLVEEEKPKLMPGQVADIAIEQVIAEPTCAVIQKSQKNLSLKSTATADYAKYEANEKVIDFLATMMYTSRVHKFTVKNTSTIKMHYSCKIVSTETLKIDSGFFIVSPHSGTINPNCDQTFTVRFSPTEVEQINERLLIISIKNLHPDQEKLIIELNGQTQRPICHFQLAPSNFRQKKPDIQAKYNIIEFQSLGTKVKNTKRFYVINPTSLAYDFEWKRINEDKGSNPGFFRCITQKGTILSGKKSEMIFEYTPDLIGTHESYWIFEIPNEKIVQYFLIVGGVKEPNVFFDMGKINFGPLLIGGKNKEVVSIKNMEDVPLVFTFDKESVKGELEYSNSLIIEPMHGVIPSQGESKIQVIFEPKTSQGYNYNINCQVMRRNRPICINVKGIGYVLSHSVYLSGRTNVIEKNQKCEINYGNIFVNEVKDRKIIIENNGDFNFDFAIKASHSFPFLKISNEFGTVKKNQKFMIDLIFAPQDQFAFKANASVTLSIISGPTYTFILRGNAKIPGIDFSFYSYDFGPCFVLKQPLPITAYLQIRNREGTPISIDSLYQKSDYLDVKIPSGQVVLPIEITSVKNKKGNMQKVQKNMLRVPIVFNPRQLRRYNEDVIFDINGLNKMMVKIKGEGIPLKLQLERTQDQNIDFGITKVGAQSSRVVSLHNNSKKKIQITFDVDGQLQQLKKQFIQIVPNAPVSINPREKIDLEINFKPTARINAFKTELCYKILQNQEKKKLLNINTTAHGIEMKLMEDTIGFGTVVVNSKIAKTMQLSNFGDIGSKFEWDTTFCGKYFSIQPEKGYLLPHEDLHFNVMFHPNVPDNDIKFKVKCGIEGSDPLYVNLIGKCIPQPQETIQELKFQCMVRKEVAQKITIKNTTAKPWKIKSSISSEGKYDYFRGKQFVQIQANSQADYQVIYNPLTLTKNNEITEIKDQKHIASLFFPIPDGSALLYRLIGTATLPTAAEVFQVGCKAKFNKIHPIILKNWLKTPQRFNVDWKFDVEDKSIFVNGATIFDVAGQSQKEYKLSIYALKAANAKLTIYFRNPVTYEFIFYKINLNISAADPQKEIVMSSLVREATQKLLTIENPLPHAVEIKKEMIVIESETVFVSPKSFTIPPKSQFGIEILYRPLLAKEETTKITIKSPELGQFVYPLKLIGNPSNSERNLNFKTNLGSEITQKFKFIHYGKKNTTYNCRIEKIGQKVPVNLDPKAKPVVANNDFTLQTASVQVNGCENFEGIETSVNVKFEPSSLSESACQLIISSPDAGEYVSILNGYTILPQPKGPFKIAGAKPPPIDFKNPFFEAFEFTVRIDNPSFTSAVKSPVKVEGKKVLSINLAYKQVAGYSANGRLTISAGENLSWVFYLQGE